MTDLTWPQIAIALALLIAAIGWWGVLRRIDRADYTNAWLIGVNRQQATRIRELSAAAGLPPFDDTVERPERPGVLARLSAWLRTVTIPDTGPEQPDTPVVTPPARPRPTPGPRTVPTAVAIDNWQKTEIPTGLVDDVEFARILAGIEGDYRDWHASHIATEESS